MISFKGEYEEALRVMRVARRKFLLFLADFGATSYFFFEGELLWQQSTKGEEWRFTTNEGDCKNVTHPLLGGRGSCKVYRDTAKIFAIRFEFSLMALETFTSRRKKISLCWEV